MSQKHPKHLGGISSITKDRENYLIIYDTGELAKLWIMNSHVFRYYMSPTGEFHDYPIPNDPSHTSKINIKTMSDYDNTYFKHSILNDKEISFVISTDKIQIVIDKTIGLMRVKDNRTDRYVFEEAKTVTYGKDTTQYLKHNGNEFFFGGGMQNGRFSHKYECIDIVNTNNWIDGGVTSPNPFYWSTYGYGVLRNTWQPGHYDFGSIIAENFIKTTHEEDLFDAFFFINPRPVDIFRDYYELTGNPFKLPEYALYEAHLNAFNRDYWVEVDKNTTGAILFENGVYYKSYQPSEIGDKVGILESLNGERANYQFSARAMIDRYKKHDMPLGWFIPNDGYGSGYGQSDSLDGDIQNLKLFAEYARSHGVEVGLWTESNLEPCDPSHPKKGERDLRKEVRVAGVRALKADVAWIGNGYSFGLSAIEHAKDMFVEETKYAIRPMVIMVDGWAGTQRCSGIWTGDQTGGEWEYIRFHIPTYIGTGLSGQPNFGSDMDGIYGGSGKKVNIRDYQWKTFTPLQLNMDGWGRIPKTPFTFDEEATKIIRAYLKLKSMLLPYNYSLTHESIDGLPMLRAMFLEFSTETAAYTKDSQYQFMWGPYLLVAPIYNDAEKGKDSIRNGIYLPDKNQNWIDIYTGETKPGGKIYNSIKVPLWKIPVFVKEGAIIPMTNPNNNTNEINKNERIFVFYPHGKSEFDLYEDDGISGDYMKGKVAKTKISMISTRHDDGTMKDNVHLTIDKTQGNFKDMVSNKITILQVKISEDVKHIKTSINGDALELTQAESKEEFNTNSNVYYIDDNFYINPYLKEFDAKNLRQKFLLIKIQELDVTKNVIHIKIKGFKKHEKTVLAKNNETTFPIDLQVISATESSITLEWTKVEGASYYEIERDQMVFTNIEDNKETFEHFKPETKHEFRIRFVNENGYSEWSDVITAKTKESRLNYAVKHVTVKCNIPCQPNQEIHKICDGDLQTMWHTNWGEDGKFNKSNLTIDFDLNEVQAIDTVEYHPRKDAGNGTILNLKYKLSEDGENWSDSVKVNWEHSPDVKTIDMNGKIFRYMRFEVTDAIGKYGSGRQIFFYKKKI